MQRRTFLFLVLALLLVLSGCAVFLLATESGLVFIQKGINRFGGGQVTIGQVEGRLLDRLTLRGLRLISDRATVNVARLEYAWRPQALLGAELSITGLHAFGVEIAVKDGPEKTPANAAISLPQVTLPVAVSLDSLTVDTLSIIDGQGQRRFGIDRAETRLAGDSDRLTIGNFDLKGPGLGLALHGSIEVRKEWAVNLLGTWQLAGYGFHPMAGTFSAAGPLRQPHVEFGLHSPGNIRVAGELVNLLEKPQWTARLEAKAVDLSAHIAYCPKIELATVTGNLTGDFQSYRGHVEAKGDWAALKGLHLVSDIDGDGWGIDFQALRIDGQEKSFAEAEGGKISWRDIFSWQGQFYFVDFDPSVITEELQGRVTARFASTGDVKEHGVVASFGIAALDGTLREHKVSATGNVFLGETDVRTDGLTIRSGEVTGVAHLDTALFSWATEPHWSGKVRLDHFDPSWLYSDFPGSVNGQFEVDGRLGDHGLLGSLNIKEISGTLRGNKLSGGGELTLANDTLQTTGLKLQSGGSELLLHGRAGDGLAVDFSLFSPDIGTILPEGSGSLKLTGSLLGTLKEPRLNARVAGEGLGYGVDRLARVDAELHGPLSGDGAVGGSLHGEGIALAGLSIDSGTISLKGSLRDHQLAVSGAGKAGSFGGQVHGSYRDAWQGQLSRFYLDAAKHGSWRQKEVTAVRVGRDGLRLDNFCLADATSTACLEGDARLDKELAWNIRGQLAAVPLQWLNRLGLIPVPAGGRVHLTASASGDSRRVVAARVESRVSAADVTVTVREGEPVALQFDNSVLTMDLTDTLLRTSGTIQMRNGGRIILAAEVAEAGAFSAPVRTLPLRGKLALEDFDLSLLAAFTGYGVEPSGRVSNSFALAGTVGRPKVYGDMRVRDGGIELPYQGITLENIALSIEAGEEIAKVTGTVSSGPGKLTAVGTLQYGATGIEGAFKIKGKDFLLVSLPEYAIRINPDVLLTFTGEEGEVQGTIDVPYGLIAPEEMSDSISASEDVIVVNGAKEQRMDGWPFGLKLDVRLGDDVHVEGYGLTGRLGGQLKVTTNPDASLAGKGELDLIDGTFTVYGRTLTISRGRMLFTGGPIDNPGLDVRAQITVSEEEAKGRGYTVGMDISGLVQDLQYHLFSDPYMDDTEILSLLIVGHSLANSTEEEGNLLEAAAVTLGQKGSSKFVQGLGNMFFLDDLHFEGSSKKENVSLVVGKRLTRDLYLGYDLNMFSQLGQFRVRYDLTKGFSVETRSSSESTGADLLYSFER